MTSENKLVLVTGASRGIGQAIALALGEENYTIVGTATSDVGAASISKYLDEANIQGCGLVLDVSDETSIHQLMEDIKNRFSKSPEILINNAGITRDNLLMRMKDDEWDSLLQTNLTSIYRLSKACLRGMMKSRWGRIINVGSVVGTTGNPGQTNYAAAKAGVIGFSKSLAREIGARGVTVNVVAPGFIDTDMTKILDDEQKEVLTKQIALGHLGQPSDIANAVAFLASEKAAYITGETLHVNGGMHMA